MKRIIATILLVSSALLAGCAGTSAIVQSEYRMQQGEKLTLQLSTPPGASVEGMSILRERLTTQLSINALMAGGDDASAKTLAVNVINYRMRYGAARALAGIMAGTDSIQSMVKIEDTTTGKVISQFTVESHNPTALFTARGLIEDHADKIVETLKGAAR